MSFIKIILSAIGRDKSYLVGSIFTLFALVVLFSQHDWQSQPATEFQTNLTIDLPDFSSIANVQQKKSQFFAYLRPLVEKENQKIKYKQVLLASLLKNLKNESYHGSLKSKKLHKLAKEYGLESSQLDDKIDELISRIDMIPSSLVLAQAANESAVGVSQHLAPNQALDLSHRAPIN